MTNSTSSFWSQLFQRLHIDPWLILGLMALMGTGLITIYSAGGQDIVLIQKQLTRLGIGLVVMLVCAQIPIHLYRSIAPIFYMIGVLLLIAVLFVGVEGKGAQRWLDLGFMRFQPSEILKLFVPMAIAWYLSQEPCLETQTCIDWLFTCHHSSAIDCKTTRPWHGFTYC